MRTCSFLNRIVARREHSITTVHVLLLIQSLRMALLHLLLLESCLGPPDTTEPLSACPGDLRLRKKEQGQIFGCKHGFRRSQQPVCGLNADPVHWGRRDGIPRSSGVLRDIVTWLPPSTSPSPQLTASKASEDPSALALRNEHLGEQPQLLNNINNNNTNLETFSCNIRSRGLFLGGNVRD